MATGTLVFATYRFMLVLMVVAIGATLKLVDGYRPGLLVIANCTCGRYLTVYALTVADLVHCSAINARPFTLCESCVQKYATSSSAYESMMEAVEYDGTSCRDVLINSDRVQVVRQLNAAMNSIWDLSQCDNCFTETVNGIGEITYVLSNSTVAFNELINDTFACINKYTNITLSINNINCDNTTVCQQCLSNYKDLNRFYNTMATSVNSLCMDTIDKMNLTRTIWSNRLRCVYHHNTAWLVVLATVIIGLLPIAFYVTAYLQADRQEHSVIPQKRMVSRHTLSISLT